MRFMVLVKTKPGDESQLPDKEAFEAMGRFNLEAARAGVILAFGGLHPMSKGARILLSDGKKTITDGPFTEAKELVAGFCIIQAKSKEDALAWMSRAPFVGDGEVEIRQIFEASDWPDGYIDPDRSKELHSLVRANAERRAS
jgi:hypothetical protein